MVKINQVSEKLRLLMREANGIRYPGVLGDLSGNVAVTNRPGWVWARLDGVPVQAYNVSLSSTWGTPVWLERRPWDESRILYVTGIRVTAGDPNSGATFGVGAHADSHRWLAANGGSDPVLVEQRQILPMRVTASGFVVYLYPGMLPSSLGRWQYVTVQSIDLSSYVPTTSSYGRFVLLYVDEEGTFTESVGSEMVATSLTIDDIPQLPALALGAAAVYLYQGQTEIQEIQNHSDIMDLRGFQAPIISGPFRRYFTSISADYTVVASDDIILVDASGAAVTVTLPPAASSAGQQVSIKVLDATYAVTIDGDGSETIDGSTTVVLSSLYDLLAVACDGTEWFVV